MLLSEDKRQELLNKSKHADSYKDQTYGKNRFDRRVRSKIRNYVSEFNSIDMNLLFKDNILLVNVPIQGETNNYIVKIKMGGFLDKLHNELERNNNVLDLKSILRALINSFNSDNVYIRCSCEDWNFRFSYWSRVNDISSDISAEQTNNGKRIVNPNDTKGRGCKHTLLVLSNNRWLRSVASVIYNYVRYMENHYSKMYADIIYPAIYQQPYEKDVQLSFDDKNTLDTSSDTIDISNKEAKNAPLFKKGNTQGYRFVKNDSEPEAQFDFDSLNTDN